MKERIIELLKNESYKSRKINEIAKKLGVLDTEDYIEFIKLMNHMEDDGDVIRDSTNNYYLIDQNRFAVGQLALNKKGFGFVRVEGKEEDFYISPDHMRDAMNNDTVLIEIDSHSYREAEIVRVIKRGTTKIVGLVKKGMRDLLVFPDDAHLNEPVVVDARHSMGAMPGHKVVVDIKRYKPQLQGTIVEILGHKNDPGIDVLSIIKAHDIDIEFPSAVYRQIANLEDEIDGKDIKNRKDFREDLIVTIDGDDAKDLDDAISLEKLSNGHFRLGVHIADVSYYVEEGTPLDQEAYSRGTSIYLTDRVIPMLPHKLSNGICSLNQGVDRYTISCMMEIDEKGQVVSHSIVPSIIRSSHRMTYHNVNKILAGDDYLSMKYVDAVDMFHDMEELAAILRKKRARRGAIDFDVDEAKVIVDEHGKPIDIQVRDRGVSEHIIEEFMLCANETVAEHFKWLELPMIYRVHDTPEAKKLRQFIAIASPLGYTIHGSLNPVNPNELAKIIEQSKDKPEHKIITTLLLRSMQKARYDAQCLGHFGLADDYYTHFTSPIRRYPDLLVHRMIRTFLFDQNYECVDHYESQMPEWAEHCSLRERVAVDTEFEVEDMKKAEYMLDHIGETYDGVVASVTSFGFFVELPNTIEGLVHVSTLTDDHYLFDDRNMMLIGTRTGRKIKMADEVRVVVSGASKLEGKLDFECVSFLKQKQREGNFRKRRRR